VIIPSTLKRCCHAAGSKNPILKNQGAKILKSLRHRQTLYFV
jgi:hypothetical protein